MKNIILLLGISLFCYACSCGDPTVISFTEKDKEWLIYQKGKTFTYTNQKNDTLIYVTEKVYDFPILYLQNQYKWLGNDCVETKWDVIRVKLQNTSTKKDSIDIRLQKSFKINAKNTAYEKGDGLSTTIYWYSNKYSRLLPDTQLLDSLSAKSFDTLKINPYFTKVSDLLLKNIVLKNGKQYNNVLITEYWWYKSGTNFIETKTKVFYHKTTGIIRFENDNNGDIWELE